MRTLSKKYIKLGDLCFFEYGKALKKEKRNGKGVFPVYGSNGLVGYHSEFLVKAPALIVGRKGAAGEVHLATEHCWPIDTTYYVKLKSTEINQKFLFYQLKTLNLQQLDKSTAIPGLNRNDAYKELIFVPDLEEQEKIVSKLEELLSELEKGKEQLETAQQQLKVYRQAVLKWAFEGKLTNKDVKEGELPEGWKWKKLGRIAEVKRGKSKHRPRNDSKLFGGLYPFVQTGEVRAANGGIIREYSNTYSDFGLSQSKLWPKGTLCLTIAANIAETAFLGFDACFPDSVVGIKENEGVVLIQYINYYIQKAKVEIDSKASATAQKNINVEILDNLDIPLADLKEQMLIIQEIESRFTICDKIEETIIQGILQAETLKQSILKRAFEGKLDIE